MSAAISQEKPITAESLRSGKGGGDENFPVASILIAAPLRPVILAFYDFVRAGDDVADHASLPPERKRALLDQLDQSLLGESDAEPLGVRLREKLSQRGLSNRHARDLLDAFRLDVEKNRYESWDELIAYCALSAMPVGRFLLDVHGESRDLWPASDAICAALQINNHLQDCGKDFIALDRVLHSARRAGRGGRRCRGAFGASGVAGLARLPEKPRGEEPRLARARRGPARRHRRFPARSGDRRDPPSRAKNRRSAGLPRSPERVRQAEQDADARRRRRGGGGRRFRQDFATEKRMTTVPVETVEQARQRARKSSFYRAMAILPREKRDAMFEIYSFCRAVDDIADEGGDIETKRAGLDLWRRDIDALYAGGSAGLAAGLIEPLRRFGLKREDFFAVIDGMRMDVDCDIVAPDAATLDLYCDRVASAVGRLSVRVFGLPEKEGIALAHHLGRALQLTNILRDIDEDAGIGRLYLPRENFSAAGIEQPTPEKVVALANLDAVCAPIMAQAKAHFEAADAIMATQPREKIRAPKIMSLAYGAIWRRLAARGFAKPREKIKTPKMVLLGAILFYGIF